MGPSPAGVLSVAPPEVGGGTGRPSVPGAVLARRRRVAVAVLGAVLAGLVAAAVTLVVGGADGPLRASGTSGSVTGTDAVLVVREGESLGELARRAVPQADTTGTVERIRELNGLESAALRPGRPLAVPVG